ncbi:IPL1-related protein kinase 2 [Seminavis robusta]|uniref:IPL1-related protein kinase 2 n=1 Tax=Seminavis robusta TaxID=568900 RepID=A0A9N8HFH7_9STRA|nr:IPL1-related protein kinase 2 [Seminavis robusta]|eukprot:Sro524_g160020.1 IPL1-related protein kinase 2 (478) ;mRNA; f:38846-40279
MTTAVPPQWPPAVAEAYEPLGQLGKGGFASVLLARRKTDHNDLVAMKVVGSPDATKQEHAYAHREIEILKELQHPHIMKVMGFWETPHSQCAAVMALSYSRGPTLQQLIDHGGALASHTFGRVVMAQLVDALAYCHSRAVVHRDVKPDNAIITGATLQQDEIWDHTAAPAQAIEDWQTLGQKWHLTLIDFGFARALSPGDLEKEAVTMKSPNDQQLVETDGTIDGSSSSRRSSSNGKRVQRRDLDKSISHAFKRTMSSLGNRMYAAPEIVNGVHSRHSIVGLNLSGHSKAGSDLGFDITKTLGQHVSNYGMLADAFSLGNTIKYSMTGVPPNENITEYINQQNHPLILLCQFVAKHVCGNADNSSTSSTRRIQYRKWHQLPPELATLIRGTTHPSVAQRMSVRAVRRDVYVADVLQKETLAPQEIQFLKCALKEQQQQRNDSTTKQEEPTSVVEPSPPMKAAAIIAEEPDFDIGLEL